MYQPRPAISIAGETVVATIYSIGVVILGVLCAFFPSAQQPFVVLVSASGPIIVYYFGQKRMDAMQKTLQELNIRTGGRVGTG
jgi:hypothetical protein